MPTHLVRKWATELAKRLRNLPEYDDWTVGLEPIPCDKTWVKKCGNCKTCSCTIGTLKKE